MDVLIALLACVAGFAVGYRFRIWFAARQANGADADADAGAEGHSGRPPASGS